MEIRNRMADVESLMCGVCQEFLGMVITEGWQDELYKRAKDAVKNNKHKGDYKAIYDKMRDIGVDNYCIQDTDISVISVIIQYNNKLAPTQPKTKNAIDQVRRDRNEIKHPNENEDSEELYLRGLIALINLRTFVKTVDEFETTIDDEVRASFRKNSLAKIEELKDTLDDERISLIQKYKEMDRHIAQMLDSNNDIKTWISIKELYRRKGELEGNKNLVFEFCERASNAGVPRAHYEATLYALLKEDYEDVLRHFLMTYNSFKQKQDHVGVNNILDIINMYYNGTGIVCDEMKQIISELKEMGHDITQKDYGHYQWNRP